MGKYYAKHEENKNLTCLTAPYGGFRDVKSIIFGVILWGILDVIILVTSFSYLILFSSYLGKNRKWKMLHVTLPFKSTASYFILISREFKRAHFRPLELFQYLSYFLSYLKKTEEGGTFTTVVEKVKVWGKGFTKRIYWTLFWLDHFPGPSIYSNV